MMPPLFRPDLAEAQFRALEGARQIEAFRSNHPDFTGDHWELSEGVEEKRGTVYARYVSERKDVWLMVEPLGTGWATPVVVSSHDLPARFDV